MGVNYYLRKNICKCCNRYDEIHIGKSSGGWNFALHVYSEDNIHTLQDWNKLFLDGGNSIFSGYREELKLEEMMEIITHRKGKEGAFERMVEEHYSDRVNYNVHWPITFEKGNNNLVRSKMDGKHCIGHGETWDLIVGEFS